MQRAAVHALTHMVNDDLIRIQQQSILALGVGAHGENDLAGLDPLVLDVLVLGLGEAHHHIADRGILRIGADDDVALDGILHVLLELLGGGGIEIVHPQLLDVKELGEGQGLHMALHTGAIQTDGDLLLVGEHILGSYGGLGTGAEVGNQSTVHYALELADGGIDQQDHGRYIGQTHFTALSQKAAGPLDTGNVLPADVGRHGIHKAVVIRIRGRFAQVQIDLGGVDGRALAEADKGLVYDLDDVLHCDEAVNVRLVQKQGFVFHDDSSFSKK